MSKPIKKSLPVRSLSAAMAALLVPTLLSCSNPLLGPGKGTLTQHDGSPRATDEGDPSAQAGQVAVDSEVVDVEVVMAGEGMLTADVVSSDSRTQVIQAGQLAVGASLTMPPGSVPTPATISFREAEPLSVGSLAVSMSFDATPIVASGPALVLSSNVSFDAPAASPFTLAIALPAGFSLAGGRHVAVIYRQIRADDGGRLVEGVIPESEIEIRGDVAVFKTRYFGAYQTVYTSAPVTVAASKESSKAIAAKGGTIVAKVAKVSKDVEVVEVADDAGEIDEPDGFPGGGPGQGPAVWRLDSGRDRPSYVATSSLRLARDDGGWAAAWVDSTGGQNEVNMRLRGLNPPASVSTSVADMEPLYGAVSGLTLDVSETGCYDLAWTRASGVSVRHQAVSGHLPLHDGPADIPHLYSLGQAPAGSTLGFVGGGARPMAFYDVDPAGAHSYERSDYGGSRGVVTAVGGDAFGPIVVANVADLHPVPAGAYVWGEIDAASGFTLIHAAAVEEGTGDIINFPETGVFKTEPSVNQTPAVVVLDNGVIVVFGMDGTSAHVASGLAWTFVPNEDGWAALNWFNCSVDEAVESGSVVVGAAGGNLAYFAWESGVGVARHVSSCYAEIAADGTGTWYPGPSSAPGASARRPVVSVSRFGTYSAVGWVAERAGVVDRDFVVARGSHRSGGPGAPGDFARPDLPPAPVELSAADQRVADAAVAVDEAGGVSAALLRVNGDGTRSLRFYELE